MSPTRSASARSSNACSGSTACGAQRSPKTAGQNKPKRTCPIFPELRPYLERAVAAAKADGREKLIPFIRPGYNPHTQLERFIERSGVKAWPKLWANMRSTRETELLAEGHPIHVVTAWIGHSERVARRHYLQVTAEDWDKATGAARCRKRCTSDLRVCAIDAATKHRNRDSDSKSQFRGFSAG